MGSSCSCCEQRVKAEKLVEEEVTFNFDPNYKCEVCHRPFGRDSKIVEFEGKAYHAEHFICHVCDMNLTKEGALPVYYKKKLWCEPHYMEYLLKKKRENQPTLYCVVCDDAIQDPNDVDEYERALDFDWHSKCLVCCKCNVSLFGEKIYTKSGTFSKGEVIWCKKCFLKYNTGNCVKCEKLLSGKVCRIEGRGYHGECFRCAACDKPLKKRYVAHEKEVYCKPDYDRLFGVHCHHCKKLVEGPYHTAFDHDYHEKCFVCGECNQPLQTGKFDWDEIDKKLYCDEDFKQKRIERKAVVIKQQEFCTLEEFHAVV